MAASGAVVLISTCLVFLFPCSINLKEGAYNSAAGFFEFADPEKMVIWVADGFRVKK